MNDDFFLVAVELTVRGLEAVGMVVIIVGAIAALARFARANWSRDVRNDGMQNLRTDLGRAILLGLEFLVAADIINTVAIEPTLESLAILAGIVAIRTFLSFSLEVEIEGAWPWARKRKAGG